jgi:hypothetical protein
MGNQNLDWQGVPLEFEQEWRKTFAASQESLNLSISCPICGQSTLHQYYQRAKLGRIRSIGSRWEWCSGCRTYEHSSVVVPEWWIPPNLDFDTLKLTAEPEILEQAICQQTSE